MMANAVEMQQLLMSMDPSSANQFNAMNKGGACVLTTSGGSASPTSSTGAPSSSSLMGEIDEKDQMQSQLLHNGMAAGLGGNAWLSMLLQQQTMPEANMKPSVELADMVQNPQQMLELLNNSTDISKLAAQLGLHKSNEIDADDQREQSSSPPPAVSLNSTLAAMMLPTTSTSVGCSAASTTSSADSTGSSVIVNGAAAVSAGIEEEEMPPAKKQKTEEEMPATPSHLMQTLLAQMGLNPLHNQKQLKDELLFGGLFPQSLTGLPLVFQSPVHQQFNGMQDFEPLATPNKGNGVKRQYSSNGKNYCDICNKEVCNKYFLRTHMLKMHGIVIDENKTVIANIDTLIKERDGELSFRCDTCRTMFKTRAQLRQHRQDVHGVLPLSTPRNNQNKPTISANPAANNIAGSNAASLDEKCQMCDKRVMPALMMAHMAQEHIGPMTSNGAPDLTQIITLMNQAVGRTSTDEKEGSVIDCSECNYKTRDQKNLELHLERHHKMNEAKQREEEEDVALKLTTEAALQMVVQNQSNIESDSTAAALNLTKKEVEEEKVAGPQNERNSQTSGSLSPNGSIPEAFGKAIGDQTFPTQTFLVRSNDKSGCFLTEFLAQLPVRSMVNGPRQIVFDLLPTPTPNGA